MAKDDLARAVDLADNSDDVNQKLKELAAFGSREDRIVAESLE